MSNSIIFNNCVTLIISCVFFYLFAIKLPTFPFHIWVTWSSCRSTQQLVLFYYAGILLKMGAFGLIRINITLFPESCIYFLPLIIILSFNFFNLYVCNSFTTNWYKKNLLLILLLVHMNFCLLGLFSFKLEAFQGALFLLYRSWFILLLLYSY